MLMLALVCFALETPPTLAADASPTAATSITPTPAPARTAVAPPPAVWDSVAGNQTRMIQVGLIVIVIGIFLLSRSIK